MSFTVPARGLTIAVAAVNVVDIVVHVLVDDVEPLRVTANVIVIVTALALLFWSRVRHALTPLFAAVASLGLNLVFIATQGIGSLGVILIATTTVLLVAIALVMRRRS